MSAIAGAAILLLTACDLFISAPVAIIAATPLSGASPLQVLFDGTDSFARDGRIVEYRWNFGDGATATGSTASHVYAPTIATRYTITLTVTDERGRSGQAEQSIEVRAASDPGNNPPTARFTFQPAYGDSPLTVTFDASLSSDVDGQVRVYGWDFGDGTTASGVQITHTFTALANTNFAVTLTVWDDDGASASTTGIVSVFVPENVPFEGPTAHFTATDPVRVYESPSLPGVPSLFEVTFDPAASVAAPGHAIEQYVWTFGDGESVTLSHNGAVTHTYSSGTPTRTYVVSLTVIDDQGLRDSTVRNVTVRNP